MLHLSLHLSLHLPAPGDGGGKQAVFRKTEAAFYRAEAPHENPTAWDFSAEAPHEK